MSCWIAPLLATLRINARFEKFFKANRERPLHLSEICTATGV